MKMANFITALRWCICCRSVSVRLSRTFLAAKQQKPSLGNQRRLVSLACRNNGWLLTTKHADCCYACLVSLSAINTVICCRCPSRRRRNYITATIAVESGSRQATGAYISRIHSRYETRGNEQRTIIKHSKPDLGLFRVLSSVHNNRVHGPCSRAVSTGRVGHQCVQHGP